MKRYPIHTAEQTLWTGEALPFNLAGEPIDNSVTEEGEARVRVLEESEARKAQRAMFEPAAEPYINHRRCLNCETLVHKSHVSTHDCSKRFDRPYR